MSDSVAAFASRIKGRQRKAGFTDLCYRSEERIEEDRRRVRLLDSRRLKWANKKDRAILEAQARNEKLDRWM